MRLCLSLATILVCLLHVNEAVKIEACPPDNVCLIFVYDSCWVGSSRGQSEEKGYVWDAETKCTNVDYGYYMYAYLKIQPLSLRKWKVVVTISDSYQKIDNIGFKFGETEFLFPNATQMKFTWKVEGKQHYAFHSMEHLEQFESGGHKFEQYSFEIEADEKLITLFGAEVDFVVSRGSKIHTMTDPRFLEQLETLNICELSEIKIVCFDTCDDITNSSAQLHCPSKLWYHRPSEATMHRRWKGPISKVKCTKGTWQAEWSGGSNWIDGSVEVQCSSMDPATATALMKTVIGCSIGGGIGLIAAIVGGIFLYRWWQRRNQKKPSKESALGVKERYIRDQWAWPDEKDGQTPRDAGTPRDSNRPEEYTAKTNFEGIKTEILDKETTGATNIEGLQTEQVGGGPEAATPTSPAATAITPNRHQPQEPMGAETAAGPKLPRKFSSGFYS